MERELTLEQAREIAMLRWRHPGADVVVHRKRWGLIVEARRSGRTLELTRLDFNGDAAPGAVAA